METYRPLMTERRPKSENLSKVPLLQLGQRGFGLAFSFDISGKGTVAVLQTCLRAFVASFPTFEAFP